MFQVIEWYCSFTWVGEHPTMCFQTEIHDDKCRFILEPWQLSQERRDIHKGCMSRRSRCGRLEREVFSV